MKRTIKELHRELIRRGKYDEANLIFRLLKHGSVTLGYSDLEWAVDQYLSGLGMIFACVGPRYHARYTLQK